MISKDKIIGIDAGGTYLKTGNPLLNLLDSNPLPYTKKTVQNIIKDFNRVIVTGAGSKTIKNWFLNKNIESLNEFQCTGLGGAYLSSKNECIVLNIGSGTPILHVKNSKVTHLGGTGLGSATIVGLAHFISGIDYLHQITELSTSGDPNKVNLLVGDLYENSEDELGLPFDLTASNFGKYQNWRQKEKPDVNDLLAGLHVLVAESIAVIANQACGQFSMHIPIVLTGGGTLNQVLTKYLKKTFLFLNKVCIIPDKAMYATLYGLFVIDGLLKIKK